MMKMLAAAAIVSMSLTGASWAQSSSDSSNSPGATGSGSQQDDATGGTDGSATGATTDTGTPTDNSAGDEPQCPPGQKSADASATKADPKCVAE